jgi:putative radical SAM enzyme (TIGR03279 family)
MKIMSIDVKSPAERAGLTPGDEILSIDGHEISDILDLRYYSYDPHVKLRVRKASGKEKTVRVRKDEGEELGVQFEEFLMDKPRHCANRCVFCFIDQMPPGMRDTLYFKDDDLRMSFLLGNYITLTNLTERDLTRICEMRISPVNVSVHATDPELRVKMLRNPKAGACYETMKRLAEARISMNCQIVLCPGLNDGENLRRTLCDLAALYPAVPSVSIVPVGLTKYREGLYPLTPVSPEKAAETIDIVEEIGDMCLEKYGLRMAYCADELFLKAGRPIPDAEYYEDFPQIENGVGMMASMREEVALAAEENKKRDFRPFSIATGVAAGEFIRQMVDLLLQKCDNIENKAHTVYSLENEFFGHGVTVAGLLTGHDLRAALMGKDLGERLLIPSCMLRYGEEVFLDDMTVSELSESLGVPIRITGPRGADLCAAIFED